jgi:hypothetical protein
MGCTYFGIAPRQAQVDLPRFEAVVGDDFDRLVGVAQAEIANLAVPVVDLLIEDQLE